MPPYDEDDLNKPFPKPSAAQRAEQERIHRAWLNGEDTAPGAYDDAMEGPQPGSASPSSGGRDDDSSVSAGER